jgi:hypothetical protein
VKARESDSRCNSSSGQSTRETGPKSVSNLGTNSKRLHGSLADMLGCMKESPFYHSKQTFYGAAEIVSFVPQADIVGDLTNAAAHDDKRQSGLFTAKRKVQH